MTMEERDTMLEHVQSQQSSRPQLTLFSQNDDRAMLVHGGADAKAGDEEAEAAGEPEEHEVFYSEEKTTEAGLSSVDLEDVDGEIWNGMCQTVTKENIKEVKKVVTTWGRLDDAGKLTQIVISHMSQLSSIVQLEGGGTVLKVDTKTRRRDGRDPT